MNTLKTICLTIVQLIKQGCLLPRTFAKGMKERREQDVLDKLEAERLDRICHPEKYLGK